MCLTIVIVVKINLGGVASAYMCIRGTKLFETQELKQDRTEGIVDHRFFCLGGNNKGCVFEFVFQTKSTDMEISQFRSKNFQQGICTTC